MPPNDDKKDDSQVPGSVPPVEPPAGDGGDVPAPSGGDVPAPGAPAPGDGDEEEKKPEDAAGGTPPGNGPAV